ncbi:uncharacterized protein LOC141657254 isoform X2 [Silene latifolia]|uniref:uncharacterized protein LOC141657254 isoform X2 n=1 Tax=Silene latifolia TaxID=37657 RepID=UPI003D76FC0E
MTMMQYVATLRELLEQLTEETTPDGLPRVSKAKVNDYSEKVESIASQLASPVEIFVETTPEEIPTHIEEEKVVSPPGLRKRPVPSSFVEDKSPDNNIGDQSSKHVKLDAAAHSHIDKHRKLQEDLTDEMVQMARQLKENSLMMNRSVKNAEKILDSTEQAIEHSLASTSHVNVRATNVFSQSSKTSCFTWLAMLVMVMVFMMVVLLIRIT